VCGGGRRKPERQVKVEYACAMRRRWWLLRDGAARRYDRGCC
jgi:hypothetical protein